MGNRTRTVTPLSTEPGDSFLWTNPLY